MKKPASISLTLSLALFWCAGALASTNPLTGGAALPAPPAGPAAYVPDQLIVKFRPGTTSAERAHALRPRAAHTLRSLPLPSVRLVGIPTTADVPAAARALERDPSVAWAEPNWYQQGASLPNDALLAQQWGLHNTGQMVEGVAGTAGDDIRAPEAWDRTTGSPSVRIAVVDSGVNLNSPDLAPNIATNPGESGGGREHNGIDDDGNGLVDDWRGWDFIQDDNNPSDNNGHGTHVAGIIGARGNNGVGVAGVDWNASIIPVRVLNNLKSGTCADVASGFAYAASQGARVVNASVYAYNPCQAEEDAIAGAPDTLFVFAAGNDGIDMDAEPGYPCSFPEPNVICVAATDSNDQLADFSNYGATNVDLAAPGVSIKSTYLKWEPLQTLFSDGFESPLAGRWALFGSPNSWGRTTENAASGSFSLADSPFSDYANNSTSYAELTQGLNLTGESDCAVRVSVQNSLASGDLLIGESSGDGVHLDEASGVSGFSSGFADSYFDLAPLDGRSTGRFLFELSSDGGGVSDGVYIDDLSVICAPPQTSYTGAADEYEFDYGTSMATPYVTGVAALVLSVDPSLTPAQLKTRIMSTADPVPGLAGKVASGGRLDAARAVGAAPGGGAPPAQPAGPAPAGGSATGARFAADLGQIRKALRHQGIHGLLRRGAFTVSAQLPAAGRMTTTLRAGSTTIAKGSLAAKAPGRARLKVRLTAPGRRMLRHAKSLRATLAVRFEASAGATASRSGTVLLRR